MSSLLQQAFARAENLPEWEQDALAAFILEEIAASDQWNHSQKQPQRPSAKVKQPQVNHTRHAQLMQS